MVISLILTTLLVLDVARQGSSEFDNIKKIALANNEFTFKLSGAFDSQENVIISPANIFIALAMLYQGARGITAEELRELLSFDATGLSDEDMNQHFLELLTFLGNNSDDYNLYIANAIVSQYQYPVLKEYKDALKYYDATLKESNISEDHRKAVEEVNDWVKNKTLGRIQYLSKSILNDTALVLLNTAYFKGTWKTRFSRRHTKEHLFYNGGEDVVSVQMMATRNTVFYGNFSEYGFEAVKMPYKGEDISMLVLLPFERTGLSEVEQELNSSKLDDVISKMKKGKFSVKIPKFRLKDRKHLRKNLNFLGVKSAFTNQANFTGISGEGNLEVSKIIYRAVVEVNEKGSEAAGATAGFARFGKSRGRPKPGNFYVNHPFVFFIRDDRTGMILFYGRVNKL